MKKRVPTHPTRVACALIAMLTVSACIAAPARAQSTTAPAEEPLVDVRSVDDSLVLDIRYATPNNFTGVAVYPVPRCLLRRGERSPKR